MKFNIKRLVSSVLLAALCAGMLPACSQNSAEEKDESEEVSKVSNEVVDVDVEIEEEDDVLKDNLPEADFDGYNFRILSCVFVGRELATFLVTDEMTGDAVNDAVFVSADGVANRFNISFETVSVNDTTAVMNTVKAAVTAGTDDFDIQCGHDINTCNLSKEGMFLNMYDVEQYDFSQPWWPANIVEKLQLAGKLYLGSNYLTYNGLHWTRVLIANKDRFEESGLEVPYETIISGEWYVDTMRELIEGTARDLDGDGDFDYNDLYGFMMGGGCTYCVQDCAGLNFYTKGDEELTVSVDIERTEAFAEKWLHFFELPDAVFEMGSNEFCSDVFRKNQVLIGTTMIGTAYDEFRDSEIRYSIITYPKIDEQQENYINTCTDAFWAIPITAYSHIDLIGTITEALSCANFQNVLPVYFETAIKRKLSESPDDAAQFDIIRDSRTIGFEYAYNLTFKNVFDTFVKNATGVSSYMKRFEKAAQKEADKLVSVFLKHDS